MSELTVAYIEASRTHTEWEKFLLALVHSQAVKLEAVGKVADDLAIDSFHETACKPDSSAGKLEASESIRAALEVRA